jgi:hypothetical protein
MSRVADKSEADAGLFRPFDRARGRLHDCDRSEAVAAVHNESRGAIMHDARLRHRIDLTTLQEFHIARQARHAMAIGTAQIGPDQTLRDDLGVTFAGAMLDEDFTSEATELLVPDRLGGSAHGHLRAGK